MNEEYVGVDPSVTSDENEVIASTPEPSVETPSEPEAEETI
jgi:hypothetical protein